MRQVVVALLAMLALPTCAAAAPVLVMGHHGRVVRRDDRFLPAATATAPAGPVATPAATGFSADLRSAAAARAQPHKPRPKKPKPVTVAGALQGLQRDHAIDAATLRADVAAYDKALATEKRLRGTRRSELSAVTSTLHDIAAAHALTASRLPALFAILAANQQWWTQGPLLSGGQRVEFTGSQLVWQYYPGQGLQLQVLGTFGKADGLYTGGPSDYPAMEQLLGEMIPLAAERAGGLTWEYYFSFDGGSPPWTSAMSQATGLEALTRAYQATGDSRYLSIAGAALPVFTAAPPAGVAVRTSAGTRFLQYTFTPRTSIINAFLQTLIGLYDFSKVSGNPTAARLFAAGNAEAMAEVPHFDTGAWSLYQPGVEDDLSYHELVTGFLAQLCAALGTPVYCATAQHFQSYLTTAPALSQLTPEAGVGKAIALRFRLSKESRVGITLTRGTQTVFRTSAEFGYGTRTVTVPAQKRAGSYGVVLTATDLAGNFSRVTGSLQITR